VNNEERAESKSKQTRSRFQKSTSNESPEAGTFERIMHLRFDRRSVIQAGTVGVLTASIPTLGSTRSVAAQLKSGAAQSKSVAAQSKAPRTSTYVPVATWPSNDDWLHAPEGYIVDVILRWGDPVLPSAPPFDLNSQSLSGQSKQAGFNHDFQAFFPLGTGGNDGVLFVNHEYTDGSKMFANYNPSKASAAQLKEWVDVELAAHGASIVEITRASKNARWTVKPGKRNRRIHGFTPMKLSGPAADDSRVQGLVEGTLNNCSGGVTPWGTVLTAEENFNQYFGNADRVVNTQTKSNHARYGISNNATQRLWEKVYPLRFDCAVVENEPYKFGWIVEVDIDDPASTPIKRTAMGRFKHEAATSFLTPTKRVAVYMGDDERFEFTYKYLSNGTYDAAKGKANAALLDEGVLHVAKFNENGTGTWIPLVYGSRAELSQPSFRSQADILLRTREAGTAVGATRMDRPEDVEPNPIDGKVYIVCTNNSQRRSLANDAGEAKANPRWDASGGNRCGHIIELIEDNNDASSSTFTWDILMLAGDPSRGTQVTKLSDLKTANDVYFAGYGGAVPPIGAPDNIAFDSTGLMWIATDGAPTAIGRNDALFTMPTTGPDRGKLQQFASVPAGAETCGPCFTPDDTTLFLAVQHPGEDGGLPIPGDPSVNSQSAWPDGPGKVPRPATITIRHKDGKPLGS
jgi:uncharacterized protein